LVGSLRIGLLVLLFQFSSASAEDLGVHGTVYPILEVDLLASIKQQLQAMQASGKVEQLHKQMQLDTKQFVHHPPAVKGIGKAIKNRTWLVDPTITVRSDIKDHDGQVLHKAGTRVNPLEYISLSNQLLFIDGKDREQVMWAFTQTKPSKIILVDGPIIDLMKQHKRQLFFDQGGKLVTRFGIKHVPAIVYQEAHHIKITEVAP